MGTKIDIPHAAASLYSDSFISCVIYMYLYVCTGEIGLRSPYYARYNEMGQTLDYTRTCRYLSTTWDSLRYIGMDIGIQYIHVVYGTDWDMSHSHVTLGWDRHKDTHVHVVYRTDWDISHSPMVWT